MLDFYVVASESEIAQSSLRPRVSIGGAAYWFLHRYFVQADLNPGNYSFPNLYEDTELQGCQLHRLQTELELAKSDLSTRVGGVRVLTGWLGETKSLESEDWKMAQADA
jgi:hypothetical protein